MLLRLWHGCDNESERQYQQEPVMPTLQEMHRITASSPRSTAKFFLLQEELINRHMYGIDRMERGNFKAVRVTGAHSSEDDFASSGARGLVDFGLASLQPDESQKRGFNHGHDKKYGVPNGHDEQYQVLQQVVQETESLAGQDSDAVQLAVEEAQRQYNEKLLASTSSRQYESATLPARQLGQHVQPTPFSARQQRQSKLDGQLERDGKTRRDLLAVQEEEPLAHIAREQRAAEHDRREPRQAYSP